MSGAIASYFASLGFRVDRKELRKVDTTLKQIEDKLRRFGKKIDRHLKINLDVNKFTVDQKKLNTTLGNALDKASMSVVFEINRFSVNQRNMQAALLRAGRRSGVGGGIIYKNTQISQRDWLQRQRIREREYWDRREARLEDEAYRDSIRPIQGRHAVAAGGIGGLAARMYTPALGLALGGYGLGQVNRRNQEVISAQLTTQAVLEAAGLTGQGPQAFQWLQNQGNRIGFNYMDTAQDYNNFLSNALGSGMNLGQSQETFLGFAEYGRAMGISPARQKLVLNAAAQMFGKGSVQSEELRRQMAESMPGTMSVFAEALQRMRGTNLTGEDAMQALYATLAPGKNINTKALAPFLAQVLREKAAPKLDIAMKTSQAEQERAKNALTEQAMRASGAGVESGFARLFRSLTIAIKEASPIVESMARGFDSMSLTISRAILSIQSIQRAFQGRDSVFADVFGKDAVNNLKDFFSGMGELSKELGKLGTTISEGWGGLLPIIVSLANKTKDIFLYSFKMLNALLPSGEGIGAAANYGRAMTASLSGASPEEVAAIAAGKDFVPNIANPMEEAFRVTQQYAGLPEAANPIEWLAKRNEQSSLHKAYVAARKATTMDSNSIYYNDPAGFDQMIKDRQMAAMDQYYPHGSSVGSTNVDIKMDVEIKAANPEDFNQQFQEKFKSVIQDTLIQYSQKE